MATKAPNPTMTGPNYASDEVAQQWQRGRRLRGEASGAATGMMLYLANIRAGDRVLEIAAGTGDLAVMTARRVGPSGHVLATDISANMLELAAETALDAGLTNVDTRGGRGESRYCTQLFQCGAMSVGSHAFSRPSQGADRCALCAKAIR
jgi:SAM-dependent methyltransferase